MTFQQSLLFLLPQLEQKGWKPVLAHTDASLALIDLSMPEDGRTGRLKIMFDQNQRKITPDYFSELPDVFHYGAKQAFDFWLAQLPKVYQIYVDGSYMDGNVGYGVVVLFKEAVVAEMKGYVPDALTENTRQVAGELVAVGKVLQWCLANCALRIEVFYDYKGIECWATGKWKAKMNLTQRYRKFVTETPVEIKWRKVEAHSGVYWNERADELAKAGAKEGPAKNNKAKTQLGQPKQPAAEKPHNAQNEAELEAKGRAFAAYLNKMLIKAQFLQTYNGQFARIQISIDGKQAGAFDLYNTQKKKWSPQAQYFSDENLRQKVLNAWQEFRLKEGF